MEEHRPPAASWCTVTVRCGADRSELAADVLWRFTPPAVEERPGDHVDEVVLLSGYPSDSAAGEVRAALLEAGFDATVTEVDDDGLDAWRPHARPERAGPFVVVPAWIDHQDRTGGRPIRIDPGRAFGSGSHATTRMVLARATALVRPGMSVLDVGCGSGVLAVGAALLGAEVVGIDIDAAALDATTANAALNGVAGMVDVDPADLGTLAARIPEGRPAFDLVLANLLAPVITDLAPDLVACTAPGGHIVLSGLLEDRWERPVGEVIGSGSMELVDTATDDGWVAVTLRRIGP